MTKVEIIDPKKSNVKDNKSRDLILSLLFDAIGMLSYTVPLIAELTDIVWAPISGILLAAMYKGATGKIAGIVGFIEELIPGLDFIPTFTITWFYKYVMKKGQE